MEIIMEDKNIMKINYINNDAFVKYLDILDKNKDLDLKLKSIKESTEFSQINDIISTERLSILDNIANGINTTNKLDSDKLNEMTNLIFICTHNSRRSHLCDFWFAIGLEIFGKSSGLNKYTSFSGGTEVVSCNTNIINTLVNTGFQVLNLKLTYHSEKIDNELNNENDNNSNYIYKLNYHQTEKVLFSKKYNDINNPQKDFFAIMVCSDADTNCPVVLNSIDRFYLPFEDPKYSDNFDVYDNCLDVYNQTSYLIALEMFYLVSKLK